MLIRKFNLNVAYVAMSKLDDRRHAARGRKVALPLIAFPLHGFRYKPVNINLYYSIHLGIGYVQRI